MPPRRKELSKTTKPQCYPSFRLLSERTLIRRMIAIREDMAMAFFKPELSPVERFESALKDKQAARQKLADRLSIAETVLGEKRVEAERLAVAGAADAQLGRAEANMRAVEEPSARWPTPKRSAIATWWRTRLRRWLRQSSRLPRDLMPVPPRSWRLS